MKHNHLIAALALLVASPALAVNTTTVTFDDGTYNPATSLIVNGTAVIQSGSNSLGAAPAGDITKYLSTTGTSILGFNNIAGVVTKISFLWGSNDLYNEFSILGANGETVFNQHGWGNGDHFSAADNGVFTVNLTATQQALGFSGLKFVSRGTDSAGKPAMEVDDVTITAVPEPASWALMLTGFGMIGFGARQRRRQITSA